MFLEKMYIDFFHGIGYISKNREKEDLTWEKLKQKKKQKEKIC